MASPVPTGGAGRGAAAAAHSLVSRGLTAGVAVLAAPLLPWLVRQRWFRTLPERLVIADPPAAADLIHVLGGGRAGPFVRADRGVALFHAGRAPRLLVTGSEWGIDWATRNGERARASGVPAGALMVDPRPRSTRSEARTLRRLVEGARIRRVLLVTEAFHSGRAARMFRGALAGTGVEILSCPAAVEGFPPPRWWEDRGLRARVLGEAVRLALGRAAGRL